MSLFREIKFDDVTDIHFNTYKEVAFDKNSVGESVLLQNILLSNAFIDSFYRTMSLVHGRITTILKISRKGYHSSSIMLEHHMNRFAHIIGTDYVITSTNN